MQSIKPLPSGSAYLLKHTIFLSNYELVVRATLEQFIRAGSNDITVTLSPAALRFTLIAKKAPDFLPHDLLESLSAQCSIEYRHKNQAIHMRGTKVLDNERESYFDGGCELDVWEMFYAVPVRRRLQQARDHLDIINATRSNVISVLFANPDVRCILRADSEVNVLLWTGNGLRADDIQAVLGIKGLSFLPVRLKLKDKIVTGVLSRAGFSNSRIQYAALDGDSDAEWLSNIVKTAWKRFLQCKASRSHHSSDQSPNMFGRHAAFVVQCTTSDLRRSTCLKRDRAVRIVREVQNELLVALLQVLMDTKKRKLQSSNRTEPLEAQRAIFSKRRRFEETKVRKPLELTANSLQRVRRGKRCSIGPFSEYAFRQHVVDWCSPVYSNSATTGLQGQDWERKETSIDKQRLAQVRVVGQVDCKFIVVSDERGLYVVDQHAASERDLFERFLRKARRGIRSVDCMQNITLSKERKEIALRHSEVLSRWGWCLMITEERTAITSVPRVCDSLMSESHLLEFLDEICDKQHAVVAETTPNFVWRTVATLACHKAVRFGDPLSHEQSEQVIRALAKCDNPFSCAHGRPSIVPLATFRFQA